MNGRSMRLPGTDLLLEHRAFVRSLAWSLLHDSHAAEDVAQDALAAALRRPPSDGESAVGPWRRWLAAVARNLVRSRARIASATLRREAYAARSEALPSAASIAEREATRRRVVEALLALDEPYRTAILMRFYDDCSPSEVAKRLGVPTETARTRIKRGLGMLRARLERELGEGWAIAIAELLTAPAGNPWASVATAMASGAALLGIALSAASRSADLPERAAAPPTSVAVSRAELPAVVSSSPAAVDARRTSELLAPLADSVAPLASATQSGICIVGRFLDEAGRPVAGVNIEIERYVSAGFEDALPTGASHYRTIATGESGADGTFALACAVGRGEDLNVNAQIEGFRSRSWRCPVPTHAKSASLGDVTLDAPCQVEGEVVDAEGRPVGDLVDSVQISPVDEDGPREVYGPRESIGSTRITKLGANARVSVGDLAARLLRIEATLAGGIEAEPAFVYAKPGETVHASVRVNTLILRDRIVVAIQDSLRPGPTSPATVRLRGNGISRTDAVVLPVSPLDHTVAFEAVPPGRYTIEIEDPNYEPWSAAGVSPGSRTIRASLRGSASIAVTVRDARTGEALPRYRMTARQEGSSQVHKNSDRRRIVLMEPDAAPPPGGIFRGLIAGPCELEVQAHGYAPKRLLLQNLTHQNPTAAEVLLETGGVLEGRVVAPGESAAGIRVVAKEILEAPNPGWRQRVTRERAVAWTNEAGQFVLDSLPFGSYVVEASRSSMLSAQILDVEVAEGRRASGLVLTLPPARTLRGKLLGPAGASFRGFEIQLHSKNPSRDPMDSLSSHFPVEADGSFLAELLPAEELAVRMDTALEGGDDRNLGSVNLRLGDQNCEFDLRACWPERVEFDIDASGYPLEGSKVDLVERMPDGEQGRSLRTHIDGRGRAQFAPLFRGGELDRSWELRVSSDSADWDYCIPVGPLPVPGAVNRYSIPIRRGKVVFLDGASGQPLRGVRIAIARKDAFWGELQRCTGPQGDLVALLPEGPMHAVCLDAEGKAEFPWPPAPDAPPIVLR